MARVITREGENAIARLIDRKKAPVMVEALYNTLMLERRGKKVIYAEPAQPLMCMECGGTIVLLMFSEVELQYGCTTCAQQWKQPTMRAAQHGGV